MEHQTGKFSATKFYTSLQTHNDSTQEVGFNLEDNRKIGDTCALRVNKIQSDQDDDFIDAKLSFLSIVQPFFEIFHVNGISKYLL